MAEIINLKQARKRKEREAKDQSAEANRLAFGRTKAEKQVTKLEQKRTEKNLDAHKIEKHED